MNNPKIFLAALFTLTLVLALLLFLLPSEQKPSIKGVVVSQTVTQSLDGQRRYLNVQLDTGNTILVTAPAVSTCPEGSSIVLQEEPNKFGKSSSYRFSSCSSK